MVAINTNVMPAVVSLHTHTQNTLFQIWVVSLPQAERISPFLTDSLRQVKERLDSS